MCVCERISRICMYVVSEGAQTRRLPSTSPSLAGWPGACGEGGTGAATTITCFGRCSGGVLAGRTAAAAAGSRRECWRSPRCSTPSPSRVLRCRLCLTIAKQKTGMDRSGPAPTALRRAGWVGGSGMGGAPAAATERLCYRAAAGYMCASVRTCIYVGSEGAPTRRLSSSLPSLAGWPGAGGGRGTSAANMIICFGRRSGGGCTRRTAAAAGSRRECWRCPRCSTTSPSRVLSRRLYLTRVTQ